MALARCGVCCQRLRRASHTCDVRGEPVRSLDDGVSTAGSAGVALPAVRTTYLVTPMARARPAPRPTACSHRPDLEYPRKPAGLEDNIALCSATDAVVMSDTAVVAVQRHPEPRAHTHRAVDARPAAIQRHHRRTSPATCVPQRGARLHLAGRDRDRAIQRFEPEGGRRTSVVRAITRPVRIADQVRRADHGAVGREEESDRGRSVVR